MFPYILHLKSNSNALKLINFMHCYNEKINISLTGAYNTPAMVQDVQ